MMETKLWTALCALLVIHLGSADHGKEGIAAPKSTVVPEVATEAPAAAAVPTSALETTRPPAPTVNGSDTNSSSSNTSSLSSNTTTPQSPEPKTANDTSITSPSVVIAPGNNANKTEESTSPEILPSEGHTTTSHILPTTTTTASHSHTAHNAPVDTPTTNTSNLPTQLPADSTSPSKQPTNPEIHSSTTATTTTTATATTTTTTTTTTTNPTPTSTRSNSISSTSSSQNPTNPESQMLTSPHASQSDRPQDQTTSTVTPLSRTSTQAKVHADNPSQLNVGGDTTMVHESPTLDPLLAGLVSAFIITAVIITLLLFLKLRRRDNRPEFRRLQDLPMDDMMEDTPLSMYSY